GSGHLCRVERSMLVQEKFDRLVMLIEAEQYFSKLGLSFVPILLR
ncbi:unnamed protein product, partial [marine sediment metagenome]